MNVAAEDLASTREFIQNMTVTEICWVMNLIHRMEDDGVVDDGWNLIATLLRQSLHMREMAE